MSNRTSTIAPLIVASVLAGAALGMTTLALSLDLPMHGQTSVMEISLPCESDEVTATTANCYWDASERGNGEGVDFMVRDGQIFYPGE